MMKALVALALVVLILVSIVLAAFLVIGGQKRQRDTETTPTEHLYVSWDTMEFDKCVAAWLISRFIDKDAKFVLYPQGTEIGQGTAFDVPGAEWSRKHRKCTSQCVLESIENPDPAVEKIVSIASKTELNFWQLDRWPQAQRCFYEVKEIMDQNPDPLECYKKTTIYFDQLYGNFKKDSSTGNDIQHY